jgi:RHS repeat-associated protein
MNATPFETAMVGSRRVSGAIARSSRHACGVLVSLLLTIPSVVSAQVSTERGWLGQLPGHSNERVKDLRVKVIGGFLSVKRTRVGDRWKFHPELVPLRLSTHCTGSACSLRVSRGRNEYRHVSGSTPPRYVRRGRTITKTASGFRWERTDGQWIEYDSQGHATAFAKRTGVMATIERDPAGRLAGLRDRLGHRVIEYDYDGEGHIIRVTDYSGRAVHYEYTGDRLTRVRDVRGKVWSYEYSNNRLAASTDPEGLRLTYSYTSQGLVSSIKDQDGIGVEYKYDYDRNRRLYYVQERRSGGRIVERWYHLDDGLVRADLNGRTALRIRTDGNRRIMTDRNGNDTQVEIDSSDRITRVVFPDGSDIKREMTLFNLPRSVTNENGVTTRYEYDSRGNRTRMIEAFGRAEERVTEFEYDAFSRLVRRRQVASSQAQDRVVEFDYDDYGNRRRITDAEGNSYTLEYNVLGLPVRITDPRGKVWSRVYDAAGNLIERRDPNGGTVSYEYDGLGHATRITDEVGAVTELRYDDRHSLTRVTDALGGRWTYEYNGGGLVTRATDPEGRVIRYRYDADGRLTSIVDGAGNETEAAYSWRHAIAGGDPGRLERISYPTFRRERVYDARDRLVVETDVSRDGAIRLTTRFNYDPGGNLVMITEPDGTRTKFAYDALNRLTQQTLPAGRVIAFQRDPWDQLLRIVDSLGHATRALFDRNGRQTAEITPAGRTTSFLHDPAGNLQAVTDPRGASVNYFYDDAGRLVGEQSLAPGAQSAARTVTYGYNLRGDLMSYSDGSVSGTYTVDPLGRVLSMTTDFGPFAAGSQYSYYRNGLLRSVTGPDGITLAYSYDLANRLRAIDVSDLGTVSYTGYDWLVPTEIALPGGVTRHYEYDDFLRPTRILSLDAGGGVILDQRHTFDLRDRLTKRLTESGLYRYEYDAASRLTVADRPYSSESFVYDGADNRRPGDPETQAAWQYGPDNELQTTDGAAYSYDAAGNRIAAVTADEERHFSYDEYGRLARVTTATGQVLGEYAYDPFWRRTWKEVNGERTYFYYTDNGLTTEFDAAGTLRRSYGYEPESIWTTAPLYARDESGAHHYYHGDELGTPRRLTDTSGQVVWAAEYSSYGSAELSIADVSNPLRFPGQHYDKETGLAYNWHRYYDTSTGGYISPDPLGIAGDFNRYLYAGGDPVNLVDPLGLSFVGDAWRAVVRNGLGCAADAAVPVFGDDIADDVLHANQCSTACKIGKVVGIASGVWNLAKNVYLVAKGVTYLSRTSRAGGVPAGRGQLALLQQNRTLGRNAAARRAFWGSVEPRPTRIVKLGASLARRLGSPLDEDSLVNAQIVASALGTMGSAPGLGSKVNDLVSPFDPTYCSSECDD